MKMSVVCRLSSVVLSIAVLALSGCSSYRWTSSVPEELRTVAVPVFENRTSSAELGPIVTRYTLREFQREGTFSIRRSGDSALEVQGSIVKAHRSAAAYDRNYSSRASEYRYIVMADVSLINKDTGKVLMNNRRYVAETTFLTRGDLLTSQRDAASRIAQDFARQIVDDVTSFDYERQGK
jgi:hypothetical protein